MIPINIAHGRGELQILSRRHDCRRRAGDVYDESALTARLIEATDLMPDRSKGRHLRGAATLVAEASHMTTNWPGQPSWHFVLAVERELRVAPPSIEDERTRTQLIVPVERRRLRITSEVEASSGATEAIVLGVRIVANGQQVERRGVRPA